MMVGSKIKKIILCRGLGSRDAYSSCPSILRLWVRIPLGEETKINETKTGEAQTFKNYWCLHSRNCLYHFSPSKDAFSIWPYFLLQIWHIWFIHCMALTLQGWKDKFSLTVKKAFKAINFHVIYKMPFSKVGYFKKLQKITLLISFQCFPIFSFFTKINDNLMLKNIFTNCNPVQSWGSSTRHSILIRLCVN